ncbi:Uma2 family endonuclease [Leptolyngbya sp. 7M]|uniref:Uma2 family endonuclease n=1 Tax=Leptolyngbya sp. 7M TaxID=2812896 RepID=UPI001B8D5A10|nr:Uma2 family endonuclease [Leptolyngbya sp. 7M]QYO64952.1 Uma2 family endonuclease [Leptolyngbya sp. 7M]
MTTFSPLDLDDDRLFPDSDGKPMADNTEQFRWIVLIKENLEILFADDLLVFVAGDLLWYPVRSTLIDPTAPDVMVVFGRPKGRRGSYRQWQEDNIPPQVVFEIRSPSNTDTALTRKQEFYETYGVEEYYLYDPETNQCNGWLRQQGRLVPIPDLNDWISPRLQIRFHPGLPELTLYYPDGRKFLSSIELEQRAREAEQRAASAESALEQERQRAERLAAYLRSLGISEDQLPEV